MWNKSLRSAASDATIMENWNIEKGGTNSLCLLPCNIKVIANLPFSGDRWWKTCVRCRNCEPKSKPNWSSLTPSRNSMKMQVMKIPENTNKDVYRNITIRIHNPQNYHKNPDVELLEFVCCCEHCITFYCCSGRLIDSVFANTQFGRAYHFGKRAYQFGRA